MNAKLSLGLAGLVSILAGALLATQSLVNGALSALVGVGIFAATVSFCTGLLTIALVALILPKARAGVLRMAHLFTTGQLPLWMCLGGVVGAMIVVSQSVTVPIMGVTVFSTAFIAGQLVGALWIDTTDLPPGGKKPITRWRIVGVVIVVAAVVISSIGALHGGFGWAWPLFPFFIGCFTGFQQAANGRVKVAAESSVASTFMNFATGSLFLGLVSVVLTAAGAEWVSLPELPAQSWLLVGGVLGIMVIGFSAWAVEHLGVLILNLLVLIGNMIGSILIDLAAGHANTALSPLSLTAVSLVVVGTVIAMIPTPNKRSVSAISPSATQGQAAPWQKTDPHNMTDPVQRPVVASAQSQLQTAQPSLITTQSSQVGAAQSAGAASTAEADIPNPTGSSTAPGTVSVTTVDGVPPVPHKPGQSISFWAMGESAGSTKPDGQQILPGSEQGPDKP